MGCNSRRFIILSLCSRTSRHTIGAIKVVDFHFGTYSNTFQLGSYNFSAWQGIKFINSSRLALAISLLIHHCLANLLCHQDGCLCRVEPDQTRPADVINKLLIYKIEHKKLSQFANFTSGNDPPSGALTAFVWHMHNISG